MKDAFIVAIATLVIVVVGWVPFSYLCDEGYKFFAACWAIFFVTFLTALSEDK